MLKTDILIETLYTELAFEERFKAVKNDGFNAIELWDWNNKDLDFVKQALADNNLKIAAMSGDGPYTMSDPKDKKNYIDFIKTSLDAAKKVGCPTLVIHSDSLLDPPKFVKPLSGEYSDLTRFLAMFDVLKEITPLAEQAGVMLVLEPLNIIKDHCGNFLKSTKDAVDLVAAVDSPNLKVLYDIYHMYLNEGRINETLEKFLPYIGHIHVADAPGRHEPGTGAINYSNVLKLLDKLNYEYYVGYEFFPSKDTDLSVKSIKNLEKSV